MKCSGCEENFDASQFTQQLAVPTCFDCTQEYMRHEEREINKCADIREQDSDRFG